MVEQTRQLRGPGGAGETRAGERRPQEEEQRAEPTTRPTSPADPAGGEPEPVPKLPPR